MRFLAFGTYDVRRHPRVGVLIEGLRARGDEVIEVNEPMGLSTADRVALVRQPWRLPAFALGLGHRWWGLRRRARAIRSQRPDAVLVGYLGHFDVRLARRLFPGTTIVLDHLVSAAGTARDRGLSGPRWKDRLMGAIDAGALRSADLIVVDTEENLAALVPVDRDRAVVVPVGAGADWFDAGGGASPQPRGPGSVVGAEAGAGAAPGAEAEAGAGVAPGAGVGGGAGPGAGADGGAGGGAGGDSDAGTGPGGDAVSATRAGAALGDGRLRVIFVGLFTPLHGTQTLGTTLGLLAADDRIEVTMVGTGQDHEACRRAAGGNPRVTWLDWVDAAELPALVARHQVSLGIFGTTVKAANVVPTKVFQGAAAGCAIVTSDTAPQRRELGEAAAYVPPGDARALADVLRDLAANPDRLAGLRAAAAARAAQRFSPATVVEPMRRRVAALVAGQSTVEAIA